MEEEISFSKVAKDDRESTIIKFDRNALRNAQAQQESRPSLDEIFVGEIARILRLFF